MVSQLWVLIRLHPRTWTSVVLSSSPWTLANAGGSCSCAACLGAELRRGCRVGLRLSDSPASLDQNVCLPSHFFAFDSNIHFFRCAHFPRVRICKISYLNFAQWTKGKCHCALQSVAVPLISFLKVERAEWENAEGEMVGLGRRLEGFSSFQLVLYGKEGIPLVVIPTCVMRFLGPGWSPAFTGERLNWSSPHPDSRCPFPFPVHWCGSLTLMRVKKWPQTTEFMCSFTPCC